MPSQKLQLRCRVRKQQAARRQQQAAQAGAASKTRTLVNERDDSQHYVIKRRDTHLLQCRFQNSKSSCPAQQS
jgi:hypothetical protein